MTTPTPTDIVESVARDAYERARAGVSDSHPMRDKPWESLTGFVQYHWRQEVLETVRATLTALMPLVEGWEVMAEEDDALTVERLARCDQAIAAGAIDAAQEDAKYARVSEATAKTRLGMARQLRGVIEG